MRPQNNVLKYNRFKKPLSKELQDKVREALQASDIPAIQSALRGYARHCGGAVRERIANVLKLASLAEMKQALDEL